ncbi:MAG TPA: twin-arginine translocation signal domain-containing protein, partial [Dehalococcoidia bacterium]|nr:twin-arginine translocation signal domain-containing protein [Dehalococcoidia bacterium]
PGASAQVLRLSRRRFLAGSASIAGLAAIGSWQVIEHVAASGSTSGTACCQSAEFAGALETPSGTAIATSATSAATAVPAAGGINVPPLFYGGSSAAAAIVAPPPPPAPAPALSPEEEAAAEALANYGIVIVLDGQDWGADEATRLTNIGSVVSAFASLPGGVRGAIVGHRQGRLHVLSNRSGATQLGWHPYGSFPIGYYSNSDRGPGVVPANQVVGIPGFAYMSIGHEMLHAYQFRGVGPDGYGSAMVGAEMKSFAAATGWVQLASDAEVASTAASDPSWSRFNSLFRYDGPPLTYINSGGATATLNAINPIEAFAITGSFLYTRPRWLPQPDWPDYWRWFRANLG